jgi:two-component system, sensor histidine kinase LadS
LVKKGRNILVFKWLFSLLIFFVHFQVSSGDFVSQNGTITLNDTSKIYKIGKEVFLLKDESSKLSVEEVAKSQKFISSQNDVPVFGSTAAAVWVAFNCKNSVAEEWFIEVGTSYIENIDLFSKNKADKWEKKHVSLKDHFSDRSVNSNQYILPLDIPPGETRQFFMRVKSNTIIKLPLRIASIQKLYESNHQQDTSYGLYFGLVVALSMYNLFVFFYLRDKTHIYYILYVLLVAMNVAYVKGYSLEYIFAEAPFLNHINYFVAASLVFTMFFTEAFLNLKSLASQYNWVYKSFILITCLCLLLTLLGFDLFAFEILMALVILLTPVIIVFAIYSYQKGFTPARFYLLAFIFLATGTITFILKDQGVLPVNFFTENSMTLGSALEAIVLSFALADKLNQYKKEIEEAHSLALERAGEFSKVLIESQEAERRKIATDLDQSIGYSLDLVKHKLFLVKKGISKEKQIVEIKDTLSDVIEEVRSISYGLRPLQLEILGLTQSLKSLVEDISENYQIDLILEVPNIDRKFSKEVEIIIFRILQEGLLNMAKQEACYFGNVKISQDEHFLNMLIRTRQSDFQKAQDVLTHELITLRERIHLLNGSFIVPKEYNEETEIYIQIPFCGNTDH